MVATCLVKDPKKHSTSEKPLKHHFLNMYAPRIILFIPFWMALLH
ncbi:hypothetical protein Gotur_003924 [Gossypium turneri]